MGDLLGYEVDEIFRQVDEYFQEHPEVKDIIELSRSLRQLQEHYKEFLYPNRHKYITWTDNRTYNDPEYIPEYIKEAYNLK